ncbi:penicillin-binding transpeptidase domain-containing protein, partial [Burkholderia ambifaria]|uniref:penicillin-binding transpeptidase domain-containing protein n=1 Tax=Burkholderia ambifaria TaxID=152480 RepID=UPI000553FEBA
AQTYTAYAGDGTLHPVSLLKNGTDPLTMDARRGHRVTSPQTAAAIRSMLESAVGEGGTGRRARVDGYRIGGKTGTARKQVGATYAKGKYRALFAGMAPMSNPRLIVAVMIDEPRGKGYYGGTVAGPVFSSITSGALQLLGVPPDAPVEPTPNAPARGAAPQKPVAAPKAAAQPKTAAAQKAATPVKTAAQSGATVQAKAAG